MRVSCMSFKGDRRMLKLKHFTYRVFKITVRFMLEAFAFLFLAAAIYVIFMALSVDGKQRLNKQIHYVVNQLRK